MLKELEKLIDSWENTHSWMLAYAEEAFFSGDMMKEHRFDTLARQWRNAIDELRAVIDKEHMNSIDDILNEE